MKKLLTLITFMFFIFNLHAENKEGKLLLDLRIRYEYAEQDLLDDSNAFTSRVRLGYQLPEVNAFSGLIETEGTLPFDDDDYDPYPGTQGTSGKTIVADPENIELNQAYLSFNDFDTMIKLGRQRIILNNSRFIGNVGWRQNEQTFDAVGIKNKSIKGLELYYAYLTKAIRIFGSEADVEAQEFFDLDSHILNGVFNVSDNLKIGAYAYLLEVENAKANSSDTFGLFIDGSAVFNDIKLLYRAEYASQSENDESPADNNFDLDYYHVNSTLILKVLKAGFGYEVLEGNGNKGFTTPLATLHKFNGWADVFLVTPANGLKDLYFWIGSKKIADSITIKAGYHIFKSENTSVDYGNEIDFTTKYVINKSMNLILKASSYDADTDASGALALDRTKVSFEFNYKL